MNAAGTSESGDIEIAEVRAAREAQLQRELDAQWRELRTSERLRRVAQARGVDLDAIDSVPENPFRARSKGDAFDSSELVIQILTGVATGLAKDAVVALWVGVIKPAITHGGREVTDRPTAREKSEASDDGDGQARG